MAGTPVKMGDFWRSDQETRENKNWVTALFKAGGNDFHKRRSNSAPADPHIHHFLSQSLNNLKSQKLDVSKRENAQAVLCDCPGRCPHELFGFSVRLPTENDVDGCQSKMRETSGSERKRKKHQHNSDHTPLVEPEDVLPTHSIEEIAALPSNIEEEGIATSCKRVKLSTPQIKKFHHNNVFEPRSNSKYACLRSADELEGASDHLTLDGDATFEGIDGEAREWTTLFGSGIDTRRKPAGRDILARYKGPGNNFPDYGYTYSVSKDTILEEPLTEYLPSPPATQPTITLSPGRSKIMAGEKKTSIPGSFRPINNLKNSEKSPSILPRPKQKAFDLHGSNFTRAPDEPRAAKRQKLGTEHLVRRESSGSIIEVSGGGNYVGTGRNISSTSSTLNKTIQSISSRSHYQKPQFASRFGELDEYKRTEAIVGFPMEKKKVVLPEGERGDSFRGEIECGTHLRRNSLMPNPPMSLNKETLQPSVNSTCTTPILVDDVEPEEVVELSQAPKVSYVRTRNATRKPTANKVPTNTEKSHYFSKPEKLDKAKSGILHVESSNGSAARVVEDNEREEAGSPDSLHSLGNAVEEVPDLEGDSVDLVIPDGNSWVTDDTVENRAQVQSNIVKPSRSPKSESISEEGDIPQSTFSGLRLKYKQDRTSHVLKSELSFEITYVQSGQKLLEAKEGSPPWKLQYDHDKKQFNILANGLSLQEDYPGLVLKPEKIHVVKYSTYSSKVVISRAMEPSIGAAAQVLLEMEKLTDGDRIAKSLKKLNHTIKLSPFGRGDQLDSIFAAAQRSTTFASYPPKDIALLTVKEARRASANENLRESAMNSIKTFTEEWNQPANIGRPRNSTSEQGSSDLPRGQSITNRTQLNSLHDVPVSARTPQVARIAGNELSSSNRLSIVNREDFYGSRPATRASSGQWNGERQVQRLKTRSPSPTRWTTQNPNWKKQRSWDTSLTFPKESKKKATVDARDIERLDEGEFLNDNVIALFLRYLEDCLEKSRPELARRIYFHDTLFYAALTKGKVRSNNINYDAVKRWTSKVDLFSYDYIVVPVCEKLHWYVAIICNAPRLLQAGALETLKPQDTAVQEMLQPKTTLSPPLNEDNNDPVTSQTFDTSNEAARPKSASPSVTAQVEHMSLEDQEQEWPEPDAMPDVPRSRITQLRSLRTVDEVSDDPIADDELQNQGQNQPIRPKAKKLKRKSMAPARKYDPNDPRIITLDSLGQAHSPTCSNLKEYLICEAKERRNVDIIPGRLGMTAKGLPQQSNYCDCGVFVLGYIEKFLKNPDEFIYNILQGDMAGNRAGMKIEASKLREDIRELIFHLHAEQNQGEKRRREDRSKDPKISNMTPECKSQVANSRSSTVAETAVESNDSKSTESVAQPANQPVTGKFKDGMLIKTPESRRQSSTAANGYETSPAEEIGLHSPHASRAKRSRHFSKYASTPVARTEDSEIMETPAPSVEDEPTLAKKKPAFRNKDYLSSPNSTDTSIPLDSPLHPASSEGNWLTSPSRKSDGGLRTHNTFKEFAKIPVPDSPFQNTRHKRRHEKTSEYIPQDINDSQGGRQPEVRVTPPRQREREPSFEDILELPTKSRKSKVFVLEADHSPEPKISRQKSSRH